MIMGDFKINVYGQSDPFLTQFLEIHLYKKPFVILLATLFFKMRGFKVDSFDHLYWLLDFEETLK